MTITDALTAEHGMLAAHLDQLELSLGSIASIGELRLAARMLQYLLDQHAQAEEDLLLGVLASHVDGPDQDLLREDRLMVMLLDPLADEGGAGIVALIHHDHSHASQALAAIPRATDFVEASGILRDLIPVAREHFRREEQLLFPLAARVLSRDVLLAAGDEWALRRGVQLPDVP